MDTAMDSTMDSPTSSSRASSRNCVGASSTRSSGQGTGHRVVEAIALPRPVGLEGLTAREVLALSSRQADQWAATAEAALAAEDAYHARQLLELGEQQHHDSVEQHFVEQHEQRRAVLRGLADALGRQCATLDEVAAVLPGNGPAPLRMFGFAAGDRVRDPQSGCTGRVRFHTLSATGRAAGLSTADVVWDGFDTATDLELAVAHGLEHASGPSR